MALVECRECGADVSDHATECPHCGATVAAAGPEWLACPECGAEVSDEDEACPACGFPDPAAAAYSKWFDSMDMAPESAEDRSSDSGFRRSGVVVVENPSNGYRKTFRSPGIKVVFTGSLYFLRHGMWSQALLGFLVGFLTLGVGWLYIGWKAEDYIKDHYRSEGWQVVTG